MKSLPVKNKMDFIQISYVSNLFIISMNETNWKKAPHSFESKQNIRTITNQMLFDASAVLSPKLNNLC